MLQCNGDSGTNATNHCTTASIRSGDGGPSRASHTVNAAYRCATTVATVASVRSTATVAGATVRSSFTSATTNQSSVVRQQQVTVQSNVLSPPLVQCHQAINSSMAQHWYHQVTVCQWSAQSGNPHSLVSVTIRSLVNSRTRSRNNDADGLLTIATLMRYRWSHGPGTSDYHWRTGYQWSVHTIGSPPGHFHSALSVGLPVVHCLAAACTSHLQPTATIRPPLPSQRSKQYQWSHPHTIAPEYNVMSVPALSRWWSALIQFQYTSLRRRFSTGPSHG